MHRLNRSEYVERRLRFNPPDLVNFVNRGTGGKVYGAFWEALDRLMGRSSRRTSRLQVPMVIFCSVIRSVWEDGLIM
ncbi:hypothetical protein HKX29_16570 [Sulfitobacter sp. S46]|nr:hypothetical protein [Sulfitobacter sp. Ks38]MDF3431036.1 hypothetical protein [Sulfitobacter sp. S46]MDF3445808.1 hypothetical protein [Sulfitobacter sp. KE31]MDF3549587.1 hypothetical protein [Sulfitobacter sp. KE28]